MAFLLRALASFLALPGVVAVAVPAVIVWSDPVRQSGHPLGLVPLTAGFAILTWCVRDFYVVGHGTLAPWDPPVRLVAAGLYRFVRNPMYLGILVGVAGSAIVGGSPFLGAYALALSVIFHLRVVLVEEPWCAAEFGDAWRNYAAHVPRWMPRRTPFR